MSGKIKSKDLKYDSTLPPFLQRLHDQKAGRGDSDRHERPAARAARAQNPTDDDGPTVVDDRGDTVSKEQLERLTRSHADGPEDTPNATGHLGSDTGPTASGALPGGHEDVKRVEPAITDGRSQKKRKAAKVVGVDEDQDSPVRKPAQRAKKKAKPVKLAFDNDEPE